MSDIVDKAAEQLVFEFAMAVRDGDGNLPEAHAGVNAASRNLIRAVAAENNGVCWLGKMNSMVDGTPPGLTRWTVDDEAPRNFCADFVLPSRDAEVERLITERHAAVYTSVAADIPLVMAILVRVNDAGGHTLIWA